MATAYIQTCNTRPDGTRDSFCTHPVPAESRPLWWQTMGLSFTASGYGARIPTQWLILWRGKWRRVYCRIYSNVGTYYIGKLSDNITVSDIVKG